MFCVDILELVKVLASLPIEELVKVLVKRFIAPDINRSFDAAQRVLCVAPHPDDYEFGAGGSCVVG